VRGRFLMLRSAAVKRGSPDKRRKLRQAATEAEKFFWSKVRNQQIDGAKFRRQVPIDRFVVDFCCLEHKLVVEIDGGQHAESSSDDVRTADLEAAGYRVIRFWNNDVLGNIEGVIDTLRAEMSKTTPHPTR